MHCIISNRITLPSAFCSAPCEGFLPQSQAQLGRSTLLRFSRVVDDDDSNDVVFALNVDLFVKESRREEFIECIKANQVGTQTTEKLALCYNWGEDTTQRNTFHFQERYELLNC